MVGVLALISQHLGLHHACIDDGILAETLPDARPSLVPTEVDDGIIHPRTVSCTALVCRHLSHLSCQFGVERCSEVYGLWKENAPLNICHAVVVVETVDVGYSDVLHRLLLYLSYPVFPLLQGSRP